MRQHAWSLSSCRWGTEASIGAARPVQKYWSGVDARAQQQPVSKIHAARGHFGAHTCSLDAMLIGDVLSPLSPLSLVPLKASSRPAGSCERAKSSSDIHDGFPPFLPFAFFFAILWVLCRPVSFYMLRHNDLAHCSWRLEPGSPRHRLCQDVRLQSSISHRQQRHCSISGQLDLMYPSSRIECVIHCSYAWPSGRPLATVGSVHACFGRCLVLSLATLLATEIHIVPVSSDWSSTVRHLIHGTCL